MKQLTYLHQVLTTLQVHIQSSSTRSQCQQRSTQTASEMQFLVVSAQSAVEYLAAGSRIGLQRLLQGKLDHGYITQIHTLATLHIVL